LVGLLREQGYHSLYVGVNLPDEASIGLHRAIGMADVGVYREAGFKVGPVA
jgi:phosphinothricin acetyltransferase